MTSLARARSFTVRVGAFTDQGGAAGSKCGKPEDKDTDLATVQKGPKYLMHMYCQMHIYATILHILHLTDSDLFFIVSIYIAYCYILLSTMNLHVTYI